MLILDLFAKMLSVLSSCYLWKFEGGAGSTSESPNLFLHAGAHQQEPLEWPYLLFSWKSVSPMSKELLRRNTYFLQENNQIHTFLFPGINHLSLRVHGIIIHEKMAKHKQNEAIIICEIPQWMKTVTPPTHTHFGHFHLPMQLYHTDMSLLHHYVVAYLPWRMRYWSCILRKKKSSESIILGRAF